MKLIRWLFGPPRCVHDWDMTFPENDLNWVFVCTKCGEKRHDMPRLK